MIRLSQIRLPVDHEGGALQVAAARALDVPVEHVRDCRVVRRSIDARGRRGVSLIYVLDVAVEGDDEASLLERVGRAGWIEVVPDEDYRGEPAAALGVGGGEANSRSDRDRGGGGPRPVIVGTGPCGLFCGLLLARAGRRPILLERGKPAGERARDVTGFWRRDWPFDPESNVQFGEGGAGTFSDGKLYTQIRDREHRIPWLLREMVAAGAPEEILVAGRPHIGTDRLIRMVRDLRRQIIELGGEVRFGSRVVSLGVEGGRVTGVGLADGSVVETDTVVLAVGHSARDVFAMLERTGVPLEAKPFSLGVRIEHPQGLIDRAQFGRFAGHARLGAAPYKLVHHGRRGRAAYSFCMCPGGLVVAAASEAGGVVTNGMSSYARAEANANSGLMVDVRPDDFAGQGPLAGIEYQRHWEQRAFVVGGGDYRAPVQRVADFLAGRPSKELGSVAPSYLPGVTPADLRDCLPDFVVETLVEAIPALGRKLRGFDLPDAVISGVESRSSSPLRMVRDPETLESAGLRGLFPAGEGAGHAGGIVSAAVDGMRVAEVLLRSPGVRR